MGQSLLNNTAILVFANSSTEELKHKYIADGNQRIFDALTERTINTVSKTGLSFFHFTEKNQQGKSFGERFTNAIQQVFEKGFHQIITIGNDSPQLRSSHILEAEKQLNTNKFVIGQSTDGGFYLMGIHKSHFKPSEFLKLSWQTSSISKQIIHFISEGKTAVFKLPVLHDIDTVEDIASILRFSFQLPVKLAKMLTKYLQSISPIFFLKRFIQTLLAQTFYNKGSPSICVG